MEKKYAHILFMISIFLSTILLVQMVCYLFSLFNHHSFSYNLFQACQKIVAFFGIPFLEHALLLLVVSTLVHLIWLTFIQLFNYWKLKRKLSLLVDHSLSKEMNQILNNKEKTVLVIMYSIPFAITMGYLNPKIILSSALWDLLSEEERTAVLFHEAYHKKKFDPLRSFLLHAMATSLWYIPLLKWISKQYSVLREVLADEYAIKQTGNSIDISSALIKLIKLQKQNKNIYAYVSFVDSSINCRMKYILDPNTAYPIQWPIKSIITSLPIFIFLYILLTVAAY